MASYLSVAVTIVTIVLSPSCLAEELAILNIPRAPESSGLSIVMSDPSGFTSAFVVSSVFPVSSLESDFSEVLVSFASSFFSSTGVTVASGVCSGS